ncbi:MAG TPA: acyl carrier protein [Opitutaceae bacterium]|jgi:acyl carrier protein|nr:acyl carrier protein [Opitutaceae bacterium]
MEDPHRAPTNPALAKFPSAVLEAFERYRATGDTNAVHEVVLAAVEDYAPPGQPSSTPLTDGTRLIEDLGYDSVAVAELVFFLEDVFDVTISNEDILRVRTLGELRTCVSQRLASRPSA